MVHSSTVKSKAVRLRLKGYSFREIADYLSLPRSTVREWTFQLNLYELAKKRIKELIRNGQNKAHFLMKEKRRIANRNLEELVVGKLAQLQFSQTFYQLLCSFLFWAEGSKKTNNVDFTNSDPEMIKIFLLLLRKGWDINESKLRCLLHFHQYHDEKQLKKFWSEITQIPLSQFTKSYLKLNTGINKKKGYRGCIHIRYYDSQIAQELTTLYNTASQVLRDVG